MISYWVFGTNDTIHKPHGLNQDNPLGQFCPVIFVYVPLHSQLSLLGIVIPRKECQLITAAIGTFLTCVLVLDDIDRSAGGNRVLR